MSQEQGRLITLPKSIIPAADLDGEHLPTLCRAVRGIQEVAAIKLGLDLGLTGLQQVVGVVKEANPGLLTIFDLQKAGNDIPDMGSKFAKRLKASGVDAAILFPFTGPETQKAWTEACMEEGLIVLTGGIMTHPKFLVSEGGYIFDDVPLRIYHLAIKLGVRNFVVPGNKLSWVKELYAIFDREIGAGNFDLFAPGFITQGGDVSECGKAAGPQFHAICGSGIYGKPIRSEQEMREAAQVLVEALAA